MKSEDVARHGGIISASNARVADAPVVALSCRNSALLGERVLVRIIPEELVEAEKLTHAILGLGEHEIDNVGAAQHRAIGFPAWPIMQDPKNARHALNLVADVEWARRMASGSPKRVTDRFAELAKGLANSAPHFVPTLFEELARIFDTAGNTRYASRCFSKAREVERAYGVAIDADRHQAAFTEFAQRGVIAAKELTSEAAACGARFDDPAAAYCYFLALNTARVRAGSAPYVMLYRDLTKLGKAAGMKPTAIAEELTTALAGLSGTRRIPGKLLIALAKDLAPVVANNPDVVNVLFSEKGSEVSLEEWMTAADECGLSEIFAKEEDLFIHWLKRTLVGIREYQDNSEKFLRLIRDNAAFLKGKELRVPFAELPLEILDALEEVGVVWNFTDEPKDSRHFMALIHQLMYHKIQHSRLDHVFNNPEICARILAPVRDFEQFDQRTIALLSAHGYERITHAAFARSAEDLLNSNKLLPLLNQQVQAMKNARRLKLPAEILHTVEKALDFTAGEVLAVNLRAGLLTELTWPELENHVNAWLDKVKPGVDVKPKVLLKQSYPGVVALWRDEFVSVEGKGTLGTGTILRRDAADIACYIGAQHDVFTLHTGGHNAVARWSNDESVAVTSANTWAGIDAESSVPCAGGRMLPGQLITPDTVEAGFRNGRVFSSRDGRIWSVSASNTYNYYSAEASWKVVAIDPQTGRSLGNDTPEPLLSALRAADPKAQLRVERCTLLAVPEWIDEQTLVVPVHNGNFICAVGTTAQHSRDTLIVTGDGRTYRSDIPDGEGVCSFNGLTWIVNAGGKLHLADLPAETGLLAPTLSDRGERHWLHRLPYCAWINLRVRNEEASNKLRSVTSEDVAPLLAAITPERIRPGAAAFDRKHSGNQHNVGSYEAINEDCLDDAPAMLAAAQLLGFDNPAEHHDLCASVVQLAHKVLALDKKVHRARKETKLLLSHAQEAASESAATVVPPSTEQAVLSQAVREVQEVISTLQAKPTKRSGRWSWAPMLGLEKAYCTAFSGPLMDPTMKADMAQMLQHLAVAKLCAPHWHQGNLEWHSVAKHVGKSGKSYPGVMFHTSAEPGGPKAMLLNRKGTHKQTLFEGELPETVYGSPVIGSAARGKELGVHLGLTEEEMLAQAQLLLQSEAAEVGADAIARWREEMQPYIDAVTSRCVLTEHAMIVLLGGGYRPAFMESERYDPEERQRCTKVRRLLKISSASHENAKSLLDLISPTDCELLLAAVHDKNMEAVIQIAETLPQRDITFTDADLAALSSWVGNSYYASTLVVPVILRATSPLQPGFKLKRGIGYGHLAGLLLHWAVNADPNDPLRSFYADQLDIVKALPEDTLAKHATTTLPLQGVIVPQDYEGHYWQSNFDSEDAVRALKQGLFDPVISSLRSQTSGAGPLFDPRNSAPETVAAVANKLDISDPAATYFLQLLCLVDCTDANVKAWNKWKKKDLDAARTELEQRRLVVVARRSRAGRTAFLPGAWWEASAPNPPLEAWKAPYYAVRYDGKAFSVVPFCPPIFPPNELFAAAWARYEGGDIPMMDELTTKKYTKRGR